MYFLLTRVFQASIVMLCVAFVGFLVFQYVGDPVLALVGQETSVEDREALRESLGLNDPIIVQYARYVVDAVQGDLGISYSFNRDVSEMIADRLPATIELVLLSGVLSLLLAIPAGIYTGIHRKGGFAQAIMALSVIGVSIPSFLLGILLILVFSVWLNWLPSFGRGDEASFMGIHSSLFTWDGLSHALMPAAVLCLFQLGVILRLIRAEMLEVLRTDYIRFAWARGLPGRQVYLTHALKNTLVPVVTAIGLQLSSLFAFSIITERVFQWPGMGSLLLHAIGQSDIPLLAAYLIFVGLVFTLSNLVVDAIYVLIDPRIRHGAR
ncbi:ABC transporter permease (plasmid) [Rhodobacteraceae bacterium M382]|nr:ABC transporter permease [Rhodobacteraceae bacterium M382]